MFCPSFKGSFEGKGLRATLVGWYWQEKTQVIGEDPDPVPLCSAHVLHGLAPGLKGCLGEWPATCPLSSGTAFEDYFLEIIYENLAVSYCVAEDRIRLQYGT